MRCLLGDVQRCKELCVRFVCISKEEVGALVP